MTKAFVSSGQKREGYVKICVLDCKKCFSWTNLSQNCLHIKQVYETFNQETTCKLVHNHVTHSTLCQLVQYQGIGPLSVGNELNVFPGVFLINVEDEIEKLVGHKRK